MHNIKHVIFHSGMETLKLLPFLFVSFLIMEFIEHKVDNVKKIKKANKFGPLVGSLLGLIPQCGFSVIASNLYASTIPFRLLTLLMA